MNKNVDISHYQSLLNKLRDFIELRFGVYLDTIRGYQHNLKSFQSNQMQSVQQFGMSIEELDKQDLIRGNGPPSSDLEECRSLEIHRMTQGNFKRNNSPGGSNYDFAIENCLSDVFNYWNRIKEKLGLKAEKDLDIFPITDYMRNLRNRLQHDLYGERKVPENEPIKIIKTVTSYSFPSFEIGHHVQLSEKDIEGIIFEVRAQFEKYLIPNLNKYLHKQQLISKSARIALLIRCKNGAPSGIFN
ncbi:MAG: hypothetical protein ACHQUC_01175 [Chlamydiales bacterium]